MKRPRGYNETKEYGGFTPLPAGGYVVKILKAEENISKAGKPMLKMAIDIAEGNFAGYFREGYNRRREKDPMTAKWPNEGTVYVLTEDNDGNCHRGFKSFCGAMEKNGYTVWQGDDFMTSSIVNKDIGMTFGREQDEWNGDVRWKTKPKFFCTVEDIHTGNFNVPKDKPLPTSQVASTIPGFAELDSSEDVPF